MSDFLFKIVGSCPLPVPQNSSDGTPRKPDGQMLLTIRQAAKRSGRTVKELKALCEAYVSELTSPVAIDEQGAADGSADDRDALHRLIGKFTPDQLTLEAFKRQFCPGFDDEHVSSALAICRSRDLNPFRSECCFRLVMNLSTRRLEVLAITQIAGLRNLASRNPRYGTQKPPMFCSSKGDDWTEVWDVKERGNPFACRKIITKAGCEDQVSIAVWDEYAPTDIDEETGELEIISSLWIRNPLTALAKCAEAIGLRQGYPAETAGVYAEEELSRSLQATARAKKKQDQRRENPDAHEIREEDDSAPQTLTALKLAMVNELGLNQTDADYRITQMKQEFAALLRSDEAAFCRRAFRRAQRTQRRLNPVPA